MYHNSFKTSNHYADKAAVKRVAEILMLINGETTTLEIKKLLRLEGFIAYQRDVSKMMKALVEENVWTFTCNGIYRTYSFEVNFDYQLSPDIPKFSHS